MGSIPKCRLDRYFASRHVGGGWWAGLMGSLLLRQDFYGLVETFGLCFVDGVIGSG